MKGLSEICTFDSGKQMHASKWRLSKREVWKLLFFPLFGCLYIIKPASLSIDFRPLFVTGPSDLNQRVFTFLCIFG